MKQLHRHNSRLRRAAEKAEQEFRTLKRERIEIEVALQMEEARQERAAREAAAQSTGRAKARCKRSNARFRTVPDSPQRSDPNRRPATRNRAPRSMGQTSCVGQKTG